MTTSSIPTITASGSGPNFAYHGPSHRGGGSLHLSGVDTPTCICTTGIKGSINGVPFSKNCLPEPLADLVQQKNPTFYWKYCACQNKHYKAILDYTVMGCSAAKRSNGKVCVFCYLNGKQKNTRLSSCEYAY